ncbi:MAG: rRNA maturation RNase YbeY [Nanoarchaeota archaeon]|nr:rRNA maturation RNase YbeY [Nanoarchaeota archaeon]
MTRGYIAHHVEIHIFLIKDEEMKTINRKFRRKNKATNVLSFQEPEGFPRPDTREKKCLGEVYLAPQYIKKHAENMEELVIHGILHLLGYTHERVRDRIEMEKKERSILKKFQYANF